MSAVTYRLATSADRDALRAMLLDMRSEMGIGSLNRDKGFAVLDKVIAGGLAIVAEIDNAIVGSIGLFIGDWWYSDDQFVGDYWTYVDPVARNSFIALRMIEVAKTIARGLGLPLVMSVINPIDGIKVSRLYRRRLTLIGETFLWRAA